MSECEAVNGIGESYVDGEGLWSFCHCESCNLIAELQAQLVEKENAKYQYNVWFSEATVKIAELKAELKRHKFAIGILYKCFREKEPTPSAWVDEAFALKEVEK